MWWMWRSSRLSRPSMAADAIAGSGKQVEVPDVEQQRDEEDRAAEQRVHGVLVAAKVEQHRVCVCVPRLSMLMSLSSRVAWRISSTACEGVREAEERSGKSSSYKGRRQKKAWEQFQVQMRAATALVGGEELVRKCSGSVKFWCIQSRRFKATRLKRWKRALIGDIPSAAASEWIGEREKEEKTGTNECAKGGAASTAVMKPRRRRDVQAKPYNIVSLAVRRNLKLHQTLLIN